MSKLINLDDEKFAPKDSASKIRTAGIHDKVKLVSVNLIDKAADPSKNKQAWTACEFVFENKEGQQHTELFMRPPFDASKVDPSKTTKWYDSVDGKAVSTRQATPEEHVTIMNNEFVHFLLDLGTAMGYDASAMKKVLGKADDFKDLVSLFKTKYPPSPDRYINMKLAWQNNDPWNDRPGSSWLKIYYSRFPMYYPRGNDMFEPYNPTREPGLKVSDYEKNKLQILTEKYPYVRQDGPASNDPIVSNPMASFGGSTPTANTSSATALTEDDDPF
jgi:hypothetical protein